MIPLASSPIALSHPETSNMADWSTLDLRVVDLRAELMRRGLCTKGAKVDLAQRLAHDDNGIPQTISTTYDPTGLIDKRYLPVGSLVYLSKDSDELSYRYEPLTKNDWVRLEAISSPPNDQLAVTRVYVLPDDVDNGRIDRASAKLQLLKRSLLASLDFAAVTWYGVANPDAPVNFPSLSPAARLALADDQEGASLLKIFNTIPSPKTDAAMIDDDFDRECMSDLLESCVDGLTTDMYPHQCRSAAFMHQKEVQPAQLLDPRLVEVVDQDGHCYYYDSVTGNVFKEARYYDGVRGGILAEEMGAGKTLICLALIVATKDQPAYVPDASAHSMPPDVLDCTPLTSFRETDPPGKQPHSPQNSRLSHGYGGCRSHQIRESVAPSH